jgi:cytochrome P450
MHEAPIKGVPVIESDPYSEAVLSDPDDWYKELRECGDLVWLSHHGVWGTGRHEHVSSIFRDWENFTSRRGVGLSDLEKDKPWRPRSIILEVDPPEHTRARHVVSRALSAKTLRLMKDDFERNAQDIVDRAIERRCIDGMADLAEPFPLRVFPDAVGLATEGRENLLVYGSMVFNSIGPRNWLVEADLQRLSDVTPWIAEQSSRAALSPQGIGAVIYEAVDSGELTEEEGPLLIRALLSAGVDTTVHGLGNALYLFSRHPEQWKKLRANPQLVKPAFEEVLRRESPVHTFFRTTHREGVSIAGVPLGTERKVLLCIAAANRDPRRFDDPEQFDIERKPGGHVSFGAGIHACVGQALARMEAEALLVALARKVRCIDAAGTPKWRVNNSVHGPVSLPLELVPA